MYSTRTGRSYISEAGNENTIHRPYGRVSEEVMGSRTLEFRHRRFVRPSTSNRIRDVHGGLAVWRIMDGDCEKNCEFQDPFMRGRGVSGDGVRRG